MKNNFHPHYLHIGCLHWSRMFWKVMNYVSARWWKVEIGRGCRFRGKAVFRNLPGSVIRIGDGCAFNSSHRSNLIGIYSPCMFSTLVRGAKIDIDDNCGFSGTVIGCAKSITLGKNVRCGANTLITDTDWHHGDPRTGEDKPIVIEDNVWLGYGVKVLKGVTIGENSLIGAGSIVTKSIPANCIAVGNPCKVIKHLNIQ